MMPIAAADGLPALTVIAHLDREYRQILRWFDLLNNP
jgi:hypothetical protein